MEASKALEPWRDPAFRRTGIGSSDASAVCGMNRWKDALSVYAEKMGLVEPPAEPSEPAYWGSRLEPIIAAHYARIHECRVLARNGAGDAVLIEPANDGWRVEPAPHGLGAYLGTLRDPGWNVRFAHLDALVLGEDLYPVEGLEIKTAGMHMIPIEGWGDEGTDEVPDQYIIQVHHQALTMKGAIGMVPWRIVALFGGQRYREYPIPINNVVWARLDEAERGFWETHIQAKIPPSPSGFAGAQTVREMFPVSAAREIVAEPHHWQMVRDLAHAVAHYNDAETRKADAEAAVKMAMGDAAKLIGDGWSISWRTTKEREVVDWEAVARKVAKEAGLDFNWVESVAAEFTTVRPGYRPFNRFPKSAEAFLDAVAKGL